MSRENRGAIVLAVLSAALLGVSAVLFLQEDRVPPEIHFSKEYMEYYAGMTDIGLLEGVSAWDDRDGDVTERLVIEKSNESSDGRYMTIVYAASDRSGNFVKASRILKINETDLTKKAVTVKKQILSEEKRLPDGNDRKEEPKAGPAEDGREDTEREQPGNGLTGEEQSEDEHPVPDNPPSIQLKVNEVTLKKGDVFDWADYIDSVWDDRDSVEMLYGNLHVSGALDMQIAGDYGVAIYVEDSAGNVSEEQSMVIHVEE